MLIFAMIVAAQVLTYVLPAGEYEREGRQVLAARTTPSRRRPCPGTRP